MYKYSFFPKNLRLGDFSAQIVGAKPTRLVMRLADFSGFNEAAVLVICGLARLL
ncbi:hypothetical protein NIES4073_84720 [Kalymmatonema gypsitolerans NIES-4073]|nr:hypothetical protein NIES4073_84720 [Scytonema sp. NIES-4073]